MALQIDIKTNDEFARSAYAAADALDQVAAKEKIVDGIANKIGASYKAAAANAKDLAAYAAKAAGISAAPAAGKKSGEDTSKTKAADKAAAAAKKAADAEKKKKDRDRESLETLKKLPFALGAAAVSAAALGTAIAFAAKSAFDAKQEAAALIDAFTGKRGPEHLKLLDTLATNLGASFTDVRGKFVEFRQAGLDNKLSFALIKMRADLMAVGLSAAAADKEVARVTGAADGRNNVAARRALAEISRAYHGIGDGAAAAAKSAVTFEGAQNKISNYVGEELSALWKDISPEIGKAAHTLADFALDLLKSDEGKEVIAGVAAAFKSVAAAVTSENLTTGLNVIKAVGAAIYDVFDGVGTAIGWAASKAVDLFEAFDSVSAKWFGWQQDLVLAAYDFGADLVAGIVKGIGSKISDATSAAADLAKNIAGSFADVLGIKSPSKLFAEYGRNTVEGYERGERQAIGTSSMPLQLAAAEPIPAPEVVQEAVAIAAPRSTQDRSSSAGDVDQSRSIVIEQLIVQGNANAEEVGRAVRQQLQLLLQAGALSRGLT